MSKLFSFLPLIAILCLISPLVARSLHVGLHAAWSHTQLSAEALSWIAQVRGYHQVLPFLQTYAHQFIKTSPDLSPSQREQSALSHSISKHFPTTSAATTLNWILRSRQFSPHVYLHYSTAKEYLSLFHLDNIPSDTFAITFLDQTYSTLHTTPQQIKSCDHCSKANTSIETISLLQRPFPNEIHLNPKCTYIQPKATLILYAHLSSPSIVEWISSLEPIISTCEYAVLLRFWNPVQDSKDAKSFELPNPSLQGFLVQATLKSTEYKVVDDRVFSTRLFPDCRYGEDTCQSSNNTNTSVWPLDMKKEETIAFKGIKALSYLIDNADGSIDSAIATLKTFVEDRPAVTRSQHFNEFKIDGKDNEENLSESVRKLRERIGQRDYLFINDILFEPFVLKRGTEKFLQCLSSITSSLDSLNTMREEEHIATQEKETDSNQFTSKVPNRLRVNLSLDKLLPSSLVWFNNIFTEKRYKNWKGLDTDENINLFIKNVEKQLENGKDRAIDHLRLVKAKDHHLTLTLLLDPGDIQQFGYVNAPASLIKADLPFRIGMVLVPNGKISSMVAAGFHYLIREKGRKTALGFTAMILQIMQYFGGGFQQVPLNEEIVELAFRETTSQSKVNPTTIASLLRNDEEIIKILKEAKAFAERLRLFTELKAEDYSIDKREGNFLAMTAILNGIVVKDLQNDLIPIAISEQERIASILKKGKQLNADGNIDGFEKWVKSDQRMIIVESLSNEMRSLNNLDAGSSKKGKSEVILARDLFHLRKDLRELQYLNSESSEISNDNAAVTVLLATKNTKGDSFQHAKSLLQELAQSPFATQTKSRFAVVTSDSNVGRVVLGCPHSSRCNDDESYFAINGKLINAKKVNSLDDLTVEVGSEFNDVMGESIGGSGTLRLIHQQYMKETKEICSSDVNMYRSIDEPLKSKEVREVLSSEGMESITFSTEKSQDKQPSKPLNITAIIDPMGESALMVIPLLKAMREAYKTTDLSITLSIAPITSHLEKNFEHTSTFSQYVVHSPKDFDTKSTEGALLRGSFHNLPQDRVLTISVEPPRTWFVGSYSTNYDMDNVILDRLPDDVGDLHAEYELKNLIVEGSCIDEEEEPPQGLKLKLQNEDGINVDTLVMSNHGYFQLKVPKPGHWSLSLAPGRSQEIFSFKAMEMFKGGTRTVYKADSYGRVPIPVESLSGTEGIILHVERNQGMEKMSVLDPDSKVKEKNGKMFGLMTSMLKKFNGEKESSKTQLQENIFMDNDVIHVFSVASGHLYERFLKIMITSVTKHASRPVKFWLLENYLSPSFKKMIPHFARSHGAEVGMVTYRWPIWLRAQTEKQRIIWAYKILFLDVLFPLDVRRIIFVDSDQVIRGDLAELMDIDLKGAPYGYVPFCDSRKEVEGYRFWKQGFWKDTLGDQKYRISALYVVDLNRFRETAAGDTLRYMYQSLSADPNSLSNLDQDLPNYASAAKSLGNPVPIFDLPADWLWCETWCDDESKKTAKAIDLCNNPDTKEPKLESAKRIISEWVEYDDDASRLTEKIYVAIKTGDWQAINKSSSTNQEKVTENTNADRTIGEAFEAKTEL